MAQVISSGAQRAAKLSRVLIGSQALAMASWEATMVGADLPTVNFESFNVPDQETYDEGIMGVVSCSGKFGGAWEAGGTGAVSPKFTANPPGLFPRDNLSSVQLFLNRTDGTNWSFTVMRIRGVGISAAVEGLVLFNVTDFKNQGRFVYP